MSAIFENPQQSDRILALSKLKVLQMTNEMLMKTSDLPSIVIENIEVKKKMLITSIFFFSRNVLRKAFSSGAS